jgi:nucleotide-binding universal stress UspA family protein
MISLATILVAHDFSGHADAALQRAVDLARATKAKIHLLHAYAWPVRSVMAEEAAVPAEVWNAVRDGTLEQLERIRRRVSEQGVEASVEVSSMFPVEAILAAAERTGADLIALGTRGRTGLKHVVLGSIAERVVRLAPRPVLTVKEGDRGAALRRIVVATDFSAPAERACEVGVSLAEQFGAELHLVHAFDIPVAVIVPYEVPVPPTLVHEAREAARKKLDAALGGIRAQGVEATGHLSEAAAAPAIVGAAADLQADLIVIGTHGHTGLRHVLLGSVAERTLRLAPCAVLTVKGAGGPLEG